MIWKPEKRQRIHKDVMALSNAGQGIENIAFSLGVSHDAVRRIRKKYGYKSPRKNGINLPQEKRDAIALVLRNSNQSLRAIARGFGVCPSTVHRIRDSITPPEKLAALAKLKESGQWLK